MKSFVVFAAVLAVSSASPQFLATYPGYYNGLGYAAAAPAIVAPAFTKTQYHAQDEFGQSSHGYAHPGQAAAEVRDAAGNVRGSYAYIDPTGKEVRVNYIADAVNGFRVESNALPVGPAAGPAHIVAAQLAGPAPVQDTPEVVAARAEHARLFNEAAAAAAAAPERKKRALAYTYPTLAGALPLTYGAVAAAHPLTYGAVAAAHPLAYTTPYAYTSGVVAAPAVVAAAPALRAATLTTVHNNPGHAVSYRVD